MQVRQLPDLLEPQIATGKPYLEFLRSAHLSVGLYVLPAGGLDLQQPHGEEEVYFVIRGRARFTAGQQVVPVQAGAVVFVEPHEPHRFQDIAEDLHLLVFFAPAEGTR